METVRRCKEIPFVWTFSTSHIASSGHILYKVLVVQMQLCSVAVVFRTIQVPVSVGTCY
jgi:hypothetical protein